MELLRDLLPVAAAQTPERLALRVETAVGHGDELTYERWNQRSASLARCLVGAGVKSGDRVALLIGNDDGLLYRVAYFAVLKAAAVAVPINPRLARQEIEHLLTDSGAVAVVTGRSERDRVRSLRASAPELGVLVAPEAEGPGELDVEAAMATDQTPFIVDVDPDALSDILYTSGTTGRPKGVAVTHRSVAAALTPALFDHETVLLHAVPMATFMATHGVQALVVQFALTELVMDSFDPTRFAALVEETRPNWLTMVPAHALLLLQAADFAGVDTSSVSVVMFGGAPMPYYGIEGLSAAFPNATLVNGYGLTESGTTVVAMPPGEALRRPGAVGKPFKAGAVRIVADDGTEVGSGEVGEVAIRVAPGERSYFGDPEGTRSTWQGEWLRSGDLGRFDDEGYLYLVDRKKDVIVRGGYNISSLEVEDELGRHPDVVEVAVVGVAHDVLGQDVMAVVRLRDGASLDVAGARRFLADALADYKQPRRLVVATEPLPRNAMGKLNKKELRALVDQPGAAL